LSQQKGSERQKKKLAKERRTHDRLRRKLSDREESNKEGGRDRWESTPLRKKRGRGAPTQTGKGRGKGYLSSVRTPGKGLLKKKNKTVENSREGGGPSGQRKTRKKTSGG